MIHSYIYMYTRKCIYIHFAFYFYFFWFEDVRVRVNAWKYGCMRACTCMYTGMHVPREMR